jgi:hypothetical protein
MLSREDILQQALSLPPSDQQYVADMLERQLAGPSLFSPEIGDLWSSEIDRRVAAFDRGEMGSLDVEQSLRQLSESIKQHRLKRERT